MAAAVMLAACDGTIGKEGATKARGSASYRLVEKHINEMGEKFWDKGCYLSILNDQIPMLKKESEKRSATDLLKATYSKVLVRDAAKVINDGCSCDNPHGMLNSMMKELEAFPNVPGLAEVKQAKKKHDEVNRFSTSGVGRQVVKSYRDSYDTSFETNKIKQAKAHLADSNVKCKTTRTNLERLATQSTYQARRRAFCEAIVKSYLETATPEKSELNVALGRLNVYSGDKSAWSAKMREHYEEIQPKTNK